MEIKDKRIDDGKAFDWGKTSKEYAKFRDIYPEEFDILHYAAITVLQKK